MVNLTMLGENLLGNDGLFVIYSLKNQANLKEIFGNDKMGHVLPK